jgi:hypothetical protein
MTEEITDKFSIRTNKLGYKIIGMSSADVKAIFNGYGICDSCGFPKSYGYLVPVMGQKWFCTECHIEWVNTGTFHPEDVEYQDKVLEGFKFFIKRHDNLMREKRMEEFQ